MNEPEYHVGSRSIREQMLLETLSISQGASMPMSAAPVLLGGVGGEEVAGGGRWKSIIPTSESKGL